MVFLYQPNYSPWRIKSGKIQIILYSPAAMKFVFSSNRIYIKFIADRLSIKYSITSGRIIGNRLTTNNGQGDIIILL